MPIPRSLTLVAAAFAAPALAWPVLAASPAAAAPAGPSAAAEQSPVTRPLTSTAAGLRKQTVTVDLPTGWTMRLADRHPDYVDCVVVANGFYAQEKPNAVTYTPTLGFTGSAVPVTIELTDPTGAVHRTTYTPTVTLPDRPALKDLTSSGPAQREQSTTIEIPAGGSIGYVDANGKELAGLEATEGVFALAMASGVSAVEGRPFDPTLIDTTGTVLFTPARGVRTGPVTPIRYRVTDAYGQTSIAKYTPTVTGYPAR